MQVLLKQKNVGNMLLFLLDFIESTRSLRPLLRVDMCHNPLMFASAIGADLRQSAARTGVRPKSSNLCHWALLAVVPS